MRKKHMKLTLILLVFTINIVGLTSHLGIIPAFHTGPGNTVLPITQDYETNSSESVDVVTTTIEQGYKNDTVVNLDQDTDIITAPAPNATGYETSYSMISVENISVENHTLLVEDETWRVDAYDVDDIRPTASSFTVPTNCFITNLSFWVQWSDDSTEDGNFTARIYNSTWDDINGVSKPYSDATMFDELGNLTVGNFEQSITGLDYFLDNSKTENNTWFVGFIDHETLDYSGEWSYTLDKGPGDNLNETLSYYYSGGWQIIEHTGVSVDLIFEAGLSLKNPNPAPSLINLQVNNTAVSNNTIFPTINSGIWESIEKFSGIDNELDFSITADWYTYSFDVNQTIINYTASFDANSTYTAESGVEVYWNATSEFSKFDHRLVNNTVNFTIPLNWNTPLSSLDRDSTSVSSSTYTNSTAKIITVRGANAIDGNWTVLTTSSNLLSNVDIGVGGIESNYAYVDETLGFNATFATPVTGNVNLSIYNPTLDDEMLFSTELPITNAAFIDLSTFDIDTENLTVINDYGPYRVQVRWDNDTDVGIYDTAIIIAPTTSYTILTPTEGYEVLSIDSPFNITIQYVDEIKSENITGATIGYENATNEWYSEVQNDPDLYNITIDPTDYIPGFYEIDIIINKTHYMNHTFTFSFNIAYPAQIQEFLVDSTLTVRRGINATFLMNYNRTPGGEQINGAIISEISIDSGFIWSSENTVGGNYTIEIDTSSVNADQSPFTCEFNITRVGFETLIFSFDIIVTLAQTSMNLITPAGVIARNTGENATITFHVEDTTNSMPLDGIPESNFTIYNETSGLVWDVTGLDWWIKPLTGGDYEANISLLDLDYGTQTVRINASFTPNYNYSVIVSSFYIRGNNTVIEIDHLDNDLGNGLPFVDESYQIYLDASDIGITLNLNDLDYGNNFITDDNGDFQYWVWFNGTQVLTTDFIYDRNDDENIGLITLPTGLTAGYGNITLTMGQKNYENATTTFNVTFLEQIPVNITEITFPTVFTQGNATVVRFRVTYFNGTIQPLAGATITLSSNRTDFTISPNTTDSEGYVEFTINLPSGKYESIAFTVVYGGEAYGISGDSQIIEATVERARAWSEWILYGVLIAVGLSLAVVAVQQGIIKPRKKKYRELLYNTVAVFEDAINLQHVLVIHKGTGTCVFFKTFGILDIDPDLIAGFLSAAQSFVRESMSADGISEIKSGSNHLLISDGELVRVTLVLAKGASQFLRSNTARLVMLFENQYYQELIDWRGALNVFQDAGSLIDETLHTSVILPHQITTSIKILKSIKTPLAQKLLKIARELTTAQRSFFFIAQLVAEAKEKLRKNPPEILLALNELLDNEAISAVDLSGYDEQPISEQEMNLLAQRVMQLPHLTNPEREALVKDLVRMNAAEREAALTSIKQGQKITSDVSHRMITTKMFTSKKDAKAEIGRLIKEAQKMIKQRRFGDAVLCFETASVTASNWKMPDDSKKFRDRALNAQIAAFNNKIRQGKKEVPKLMRQGEDERAMNYCEEAYEAASSMFKLGFTEYEKTVKKFGGMLQDVKKKMKHYESSAETVFKDDKKHFEKMERDLLKKAMRFEKEKDYNEAVSTYSELTVIANKIFKFGVISAKDKIKKYKAKVVRLKRKALKAAEEGISNLNEDELLDQKSQLLNIALEAEQGQDYLRSIVAYEEAIKIQHKLGDSEGATKLEEKIQGIVTNIPNVERVLSDMLHRANSHFEQRSYDLAFSEYQYSLGICKALGKQDQVIEITARLDIISRRL